MQEAISFPDFVWEGVYKSYNFLYRTAIVPFEWTYYYKKTVEYGALKTYTHCIKPFCIRQRMEFGAKCLEKIVEPLLFKETMRAQFKKKSFDKFTLLLDEDEKDCWFR